ncbi:hypothetical protein ISF_07872 [Cordyceps fumosorosea ARSEF 2679]|uniref:Thiol methyltransferase n=1 Tax=Cordyceps fumosorosea (strain ARSEF 2679) TaxID=1081104 RepID=A0A167NBK8_CORFA|nr:hypothetical protein ISF_07872 [Cordyceps fumosorosea ARSEF 2679]OAA55361.1 hypothetical protein ISF_07872 [Cordyceps fumosorosea ARSEF 2679]
MNAPISSPSQAGASSSTSASSLRTSPNQTASVPAPPPPQDLKTPSTDAFLKDFTLVAEAAKRAQVAVMVREFENCGL